MDCGVLDHIDQLGVAHIPELEEDVLGCSPRSCAVAGLRHHGCIRSPGHGLGPVRSSRDLPYCVSQSRLSKKKAEERIALRRKVGRTLLCAHSGGGAERDGWSRVIAASHARLGSETPLPGADRGRHMIQSALIPNDSDMGSSAAELSCERFGVVESDMSGDYLGNGRALTICN